jgi:flagellar biosynthesis chaperone FliJ
MTAPAFRLGVVERLRAAQLTNAEHALARARAELDEAREHRRALGAQLLGCTPDGPGTGSAGWTTGAATGLAAGRVAAEFLATGQRREQLRERIVAADTRLSELGAQAEQARQAWVAARARLRAVEALHERHRVAIRRERDRRDQRTTDDLAALRHGATGHGLTTRQVAGPRTAGPGTGGGPGTDRPGTGGGPGTSGRPRTDDGAPDRNGGEAA